MVRILAAFCMFPWYMWVVATTLDSAYTEPYFFTWGYRRVASRPEGTCTYRNISRVDQHP